MRSRLRLSAPAQPQAATRSEPAAPGWRVRRRAVGRRARAAARTARPARAGGTTAAGGRGRRRRLLFQLAPQLAQLVPHLLEHLLQVADALRVGRSAEAAAEAAT